MWHCYCLCEHWFLPIILTKLSDLQTIFNIKQGKANTKRKFQFRMRWDEPILRQEVWAVLNRWWVLGVNTWGSCGNVTFTAGRVPLTEPPVWLHCSSSAGGCVSSHTLIYINLCIYGIKWHLENSIGSDAKMGLKTKHAKHVCLYVCWFFTHSTWVRIFKSN